jgi:predicted NUDIX family NTP pyrophosphohydrolase
LKQSAGLLLWKKTASGVDVLLVHASGAYNRKAPFGIPKGEIDEGETPERAAYRETLEETGVDAPGPYVELGFIDYTKSRKRVHAFAAELPDGAQPRCASWEIDRAEMVPIERAAELIHPDQRMFLERLARALLSA